MPPKPKFSKEEIIDAALDIVSRDGVAALTARELGESSAARQARYSPFSKAWTEVMQAIRIEAMHRYDKYVSRARDYYPSFKAIGILMLRYAKEQPKLFQLLFMAENSQAQRFEDVFDSLGETAKLCIEFVMNDYGLTAEEARFLFQYVWTFTYGVSAMSATGMCDFSEDELVSMLGNEFMVVMSFIKSGMLGKAITDIRPVKRDDADVDPLSTLSFDKES